jgi:hypothetical protein
MSGERERLAAGQAALVRALVGGGPVPGGFDPVPGGFDPDRVRATSTALARKRAREVARAWPVLAAELGEEFTGRFLAFATGRPPARGGALADGLAFARALAGQGRLPGNARVEALLAAAHLSPSPARLAATLAGPPRRLVVTVRLPRLGDRWLSLPLPWPPQRDRTPCRLGLCGLIQDVDVISTIWTGGRPETWRQVPPCSRWSGSTSGSVTCTCSRTSTSRWTRARW